LLESFQEESELRNIVVGFSPRLKKTRSTIVCAVAAYYDGAFVVVVVVVVVVEVRTLRR
jgi:hypothetical protein